MQELKKKEMHTQKRLLTEAEKETIIQGYENSERKKALAIVLGTLVLIILVLSVLFCFIEGMDSGISFFAIAFSVFVIACVVTTCSVNGHVREAKANRLYVEEAIYDRSDKYGTGYFKMARQSGLYATKAMLCEPDIVRGTKVILVKKKGQVWVYKARE